MAGADIYVFSVAKTVADCFRYRSMIGLDIAIEALQEVVRSRAASPAEIMEFARIDRVASVMEPYVRAPAKARTIRRKKDGDQRLGPSNCHDIDATTWRVSRSIIPSGASV